MNRERKWLVYCHTHKETGKIIDIAPKKVVKIKVSSKFKNLTEE